LVIASSWRKRRSPTRGQGIRELLRPFSSLTMGLDLVLAQ
jgi:hypothetical protein